MPKPSPSSFPSSSPDSTETKVCIDCGTNRPLTDYYRSSGNRSGYASRCIACESVKNKNRKKYPRQESGSKKCKTCGHVFDVSNFYSRSSSKDGLQPTCKKCSDSKRKKYLETSEANPEREVPMTKKFEEKKDLKTLKKKCKKCGVEKLLSCFNHHKTGKYNTTPNCKECIKILRASKTYTPPTEGIFVCNLCSQSKDVSEYPIDRHNPPHGLRATCKTCHAREVRTSQSKPDNYMARSVKDAKARSKKKNTEFEIDPKIIKKIFEKQNGKCAITGVTLTSDTDKHTPGRSYHPFNLSIDRIDSTKGYTEDNIQLVAVVCNYFKQSLTFSEMIKVCKEIASNKHSMSDVTLQVTDTGKECMFCRKIYLDSEFKVYTEGLRCRGVICKQCRGPKRTEEIYHTQPALNKAILNAKHNADKYKKDKNFKLNLDDIANKYLTQQGRCYFTGKSLRFAKSKNDSNMSIVRICPNGDYTPDNIRLACAFIGPMKNELSEGEFIRLAKKIISANK